MENLQIYGASFGANVATLDPNLQRAPTSQPQTSAAPLNGLQPSR
jgi:hypothetical protein